MKKIFKIIGYVLFTVLLAGPIWFFLAMILIFGIFGDYLPSPFLEFSAILSLVISALIVRLIFRKK